jgi:SNF2 family DNA or RNA helicase
MDRTHRIGQDKPVFVHRLVAAGTVEEKILHMQARKQALADALFDADAGAVEALLDEATVQDLFAPLGS